MKLTGLLITAIFLSPFAAAFELDGYKSIKFGMTFDQVVAQGVKGCRLVDGRPMCFGDQSKELTLLGQTINRMSVGFDLNKLVYKIELTYPKPPESAIADLTAALGEGQSYTYSGMLGHPVVGKAWISSNGAAINITYREGTEKGEVIRGPFGSMRDSTTTVEYMAPVGAESILTQIKNSNRKLDKKDI